MEDKYKAFEDLPKEIEEDFKSRLRSHIRESKHKGIPEYTKEDLIYILKCFYKIDSFIKNGLPNQLYQMLTNVFDSDFSRICYKKNLVWCGHEGIDEVLRQLEIFKGSVLEELKKREDWNDEDYHKEYFLKK